MLALVAQTLSKGEEMGLSRMYFVQGDAMALNAGTLTSMLELLAHMFDQHAGAISSDIFRRRCSPQVKY